MSSSPSKSKDTLSDGQVKATTGKPDVSAKGRGDGLADAIGNTVHGIIEKIAEDEHDRGEFTKKTVSDLHNQWPDYNWMCIHTKHEYQFDGERGKDWAHDHKEFDIQIGGTIGYEIYWFKGGHFVRKGDGGYLNWAYIGNVTSSSNGGADLRFAAP